MGTSQRPLLTVEIALSSALHSLPRACLLACFPATCAYATPPYLAYLVLSFLPRQASRPRIPQFAEPEIETGGICIRIPPYMHVCLRTV